MNIQNRILGIALATAALSTQPAAAQLAHASATTLGVAGAATATARGLAAISVNPAGLGMPGSGFTLAIGPLQARPGIDPITLKDLKEYEGETLPSATVNEWLQKVTDAKRETGSMGIEVTALGLALGRVGLQLSTVASGQADLSPQVVELLLFGNAGRTGSAQTFSLSGSSLNGFAVTTAGVSLGIPIPSTSGPTAVGATLKYVMGNVVMLGRNSTGSFAPDKITFSFPMVMTAFEDDVYSPTGNGSGVGLDIGFQTKRGAIGLGASVQNLVNTFAWDEAALEFRPVTGSVDSNEQTVDGDAQPFASAPADLKAALGDMKFKPVIAAGISYDATADFTLSGELRNQLGSGMLIGSKTRIGAGAEFRGLKVLHLRGGLAKITDGVELAAGGSLVLGPVSLSAAGAKQSGDVDAQVVQVTLSFGGR